MDRKKMFYGYDDKYIYLDNGASTLPLNSVKEKADEFLSSYGSLHRGAGLYSQISTKRFEDARDSILKTIKGSKDDCLIFTSNTTDAINKFALLYPFQKGDSVLISDVEHTSNALPWRKHANVIVFPTEEFRVNPQTIEEYLSNNKSIKVVAVAAASNITGYIIDYKEIYKICKKHHIILFLDNSQYAPHNCPDLRYCDVMAYCGHKMYAPYGCGCLAGRKSILCHEGNSLTGGGNVLYVDIAGKPYYKELPYIHEAGTPNGIGAVTFAQAHDYLFETIGKDTLKKHNQDLVNVMYTEAKKLKEHGYQVYFCDTKEYRTPIMIIDNLKHSNAETVEWLNKKEKGGRAVFVREGAFCAYPLIEQLKPELKDIYPKIVDGHLDKRYSLIRLSAGLINTVEDIEIACDKLIRFNQK